MSHDALQQQLSALRQVYANQLCNKVTQVRDIWDGVVRGDADLQVLKSMYRLAQELVASGATLGFTGVSEKAKKLELLLKGLVAQPTSFTEALQEKISMVLQTLETSAQQSRQAPPQSSRYAPAVVSRLSADEIRLVYVVEDDGQVADDLAMQIGYFGYHVQAFSRLEGLVEAVDKATPAAIIMDLDLPDGDGAALTKLIQRGRERPIPLLFVSSQGDLDTRLRAVRAGGDGYFVKPVDIGNLMGKLDLLTAREAPTPYRILIVDDTQSLADAYVEALQQAGMVTEVVNGPEHFLQPLQCFNPDLVLMNLHMQQCSGLELAKVIRHQDNYISVPIVLLLAEDGVDQMLLTVPSGGDDFLAKPVQAGQLVTAVRARAQHARVLQSFMARDGLTGLFNHTHLKAHLQTEVARAKRLRGKLAFAMIDIDDFQTVNAHYGHPAGDRVIQSLASLLQQRLRRTDIVGRYGGEEFAVILGDADGEMAERILNELRENFAQIVHHADGAEFQVTFSCGIGTFPEFDGVNALNMAADQALYRAKQQGRNQVNVQALPTRPL